MERRARNAESLKAQIQQQLATAESDAAAKDAELQELQARHAEMTKAWVRAQQHSLDTETEKEHEIVVQQLEQRLRAQDDEIVALRTKMSKDGGVIASVVGGLESDAGERLAQQQ